MKKGIIGILSTVAGMAVGGATVRTAATKEIKRLNQLSEKHLALFVLMDRWVELKQEGKNLTEYFEQNGYRSVAIYGMHYAGERLYRELKDTKTEVKYGIDQNAEMIYSELKLYQPSDELEQVDVVVVTPIFFFSEIKKELEEKFICPIVSLEDILYEL